MAARAAAPGRPAPGRAGSGAGACRQSIPCGQGEPNVCEVIRTLPHRLYAGWRRPWSRKSSEHAAAQAPHDAECLTDERRSLIYPERFYNYLAWFLGYLERFLSYLNYFERYLC